MNRTRSIIAALLFLLLAGGLGLWAAGPLDANPVVLSALGPPATVLTEAHSEDAPEDVRTTFSHAAFARVLEAHVKRGAVDYTALAADRGDLDTYLEALASAPFDAMSRDEKLALLINAYNAFTLALILDYYPVDSIKDIPADERWDAVRWKLGGRTLSLSQIEHEELRAKFVEPRIHFAINCASVGCPPLRSEVYAPETIDKQLYDATRAIHADGRYVQVEMVTEVVQLTKLYAWYEGDFTQVAGSPLAFAAEYRPELAKGNWSIRWLDYDWRLNDVGSR